MGSTVFMDVIKFVTPRPPEFPKRPWRQAWGVGSRLSPRAHPGTWRSHFPPWRACTLRHKGSYNGSILQVMTKSLSFPELGLLKVPACVPHPRGLAHLDPQCSGPRQQGLLFPVRLTPEPGCAPLLMCQSVFVDRMGRHRAGQPASRPFLCAQRAGRVLCSS